MHRGFEQHKLGVVQTGGEGGEAGDGGQEGGWGREGGWGQVAIIFIIENAYSTNSYRLLFSSFEQCYSFENTVFK